MSTLEKASELIAAYDAYEALANEEETYISTGNDPPEDLAKKINKYYVKYNALLYDLPNFDLNSYIEFRKSRKSIKH